MAGRPVHESKQARVLEAYARTGNLSAAALEADVDRSTARKIVRRAGLEAMRVVRSEDGGVVSPGTIREASAGDAAGIESLVRRVIGEYLKESAKPASLDEQPSIELAEAAPRPTGFTVEAKGNVTVVRVPYVDTFEQRFLLSADRHWDNPHSDQDMQRRHLDEAVRVGAGVIDIGDLFCAMQGKWDKRASKASLRPEHQVDDYLDALVSTAAEFFAPYARHFVRMSPGNHETAIRKIHETSLTDRLVATLNRVPGANIHLGGYSGWVHFRFDGGESNVEHRKMWLIHGYGGGGPVTKGVIQTNRKAVYVPDAGLVASGHIHEEWLMPITRTRLDDDGNQFLDEQLHIQVPTYKDEYRDGEGGWHVERGGPPKPIGAIWLTFRKERKDRPIEVIVSRAK